MQEDDIYDDYEYDELDWECDFCGAWNDTDCCEWCEVEFDDEGDFDGP